MVKGNVTMLKPFDDTYSVSVPYIIWLNKNILKLSYILRNCVLPLNKIYVWRIKYIYLNIRFNINISVNYVPINILIFEILNILYEIKRKALSIMLGHGRP